jgi:hypothetical protein
LKDVLNKENLFQRARKQYKQYGGFIAGIENTWQQGFLSHSFIQQYFPAAREGFPCNVFGINETVQLEQGFLLVRTSGGTVQRFLLVEPEKGELVQKVTMFFLVRRQIQGFMLVEFGVWGDTKISSEKNRGGGQVFLLLAVLRIRNVYP